MQLLNSLPYVVVSRRSEQMIERLLKDDHPILFEGLHCCHALGDPRLHGRTRLVRAHNVEHDYYGALAKAATSTFRRTYFINEAHKLQRFEPVLAEADHVLAISPKDEAYFAGTSTMWCTSRPSMPWTRWPYPADWAISPFTMARWGFRRTIRRRCSWCRRSSRASSLKLVIAGSDASNELKREVAKAPPTWNCARTWTRQRSIGWCATAQVNVLPTFQATGHQVEIAALPICRPPCGLQFPHGGRHRTC